MEGKQKARKVNNKEEDTKEPESKRKLRRKALEAGRNPGEN